MGAVLMGKGDIYRSHLVAPVIPVRAGNAGDSDGKIGGADSAAAFRHLPRSFFADRAVLFQRFALHAEKGMLQIGGQDTIMLIIVTMIVIHP